MKVNIALCDNDRKALPIISGAAASAFSNAGVKASVACFASAGELLRGLQETEFQIILLDIDMPGKDGIEAAREIRQTDPDICIIFVSECETRVFEALTVQPLGFVRKSNFLNDIAAVVSLYLKTSRKEQNTDIVEFVTKSSVVRLKTREIRYIEGSRNYQIIYVAGSSEPVEVRTTMEKMEELLAPRGFIRIHKGYLVNFQYIHRIQSGAVQLTDGTSLPVGRSKAQEVKEKFLSLMGN